jgi:putative membrane-bound dehydrogenase-like protein
MGAAMRAAAVLGVALIGLASAMSQPLPQKASGPGKPLSPAEAQKLFKLPAGLRIELVACEPQVESPVHMAFAPDGRLWVVEMRDYPNGPGPGEKPAGRIRILEDKDGDGFFETSRLFADNLLFANGLLHWKDGVIVTAAPNIAWLRDPNGTGQRTETKVLYAGFAEQNPQLRVSHPVLAPDGWVYVANGLRGGLVTRPDNPNFVPLKLSGMDFRFNLLHGTEEAISGMGQFGNTIDDWGNRFVCDNRHHLRHIVVENEYLRRNPALTAPSVLQDISVLADGPLSSGGKIYPLSKNWTTSSLHEGRFTAACGVFVYRGALLPDDFRGCAYTCDPTGNLVHQEVLKQKGATFEARPYKEGVEFLASPDDWFRPVSLASGPDGALYVVDMYRAVIEHPDFMPAELKKRPDLWQGKDKGRIWRIVPDNHVMTPIQRNLAKAATEELVALLEHPNDWQRSIAQRLLLERQDPAAVPLLRKLVRSKSPQARVLAGHILEQMVYLDDATLMQLLDDEHPRVRENAVLLAEERLHQSDLMLDRLLRMTKDTDPRVRFQLALSLGILDNDRVAPALVQLALAGADDPWTRLAVASALPPTEQVTTPGNGRVSRFLDALLRERDIDKIADESRIALVQEFGSLAGRESVGLGLVLTVQNTKNPRLQRAFFLGLADGMTRKGLRMHDYFTRTYPNPNNPILQWMHEFMDETSSLAGDAKAEVKDRLQAVRLTAHQSWSIASRTLAPLIIDDPNQEIRLAAVRALGNFSEPDVAKILLEPWRRYTPAVRREVTEVLFRSPDSILAFLGEIKEKRIKPGDIDAVRTRQLLGHKQPNIRVLADALLRANLPADRKEVLTKYRAALDTPGDAKRGAEIFKKNCATCHRVAGIGTDVGPDIADTRTKTLEMMLGDILNPNAAIDNNYVQYLVVTKSGRSVTGIIASETAASVTLKRAEGQSETILREEIDEMQSSGISLMPEGMEKNITVTEMSDLLAFLKNWRYLDGSVPFQK